MTGRSRTLARVLPRAAATAVSAPHAPIAADVDAGARRRRRRAA
ncbi:hypothetical protein [Halobellus rubicundus]|uniref:Uncharacterized protein n=1 Tax=Halobellus rubicundus TaxID=2996466 RepID=A0ABD5M6Z2_9EURY